MKVYHYITIITLTTGTLMFLFYGILIEPNSIEVHHLRLNKSSFSETMKNKTIMQISDLHIKRIGKKEKKLLLSLNKLSPDIIFMTGDYVTWKGDYKPALDFLSQLKAKIGIWAVMGDYDYSDSRKSCLFCHMPNSGKPVKSHSVKFLRNEQSFIELPKDRIRIWGFDADSGDGVSLNDQFKDNTRPTIILSHTPLIFDILESHQEVLILSGDTHGGQIPVPAILWTILGYKKNFKYNQGYFKKGKKQMYVTRGVGTSHIPIRILRRPEIVVIHF